MAFASITSFMSTISLSLSHHSVHLTGDAKEQMEVLYRQLDSLRTLVEETHNIIRDRKVLETLEAQTTEIIDAAEDEVDYMVDFEFSEQTMGIAETLEDTMLRILRKLSPSLINDVDFIAGEWMKMKNMYSKNKDLKPQPFDLCDSPQEVLKSMNIMVGYDSELEMMLDKVVRGHKEDLVMSLVGMGGIGKTTFATRIFNEPLIMSHFDIRAEITVSQEYELRNLYLGLLHYTSSKSEGLDAEDDGELAELLQKSLKGRRYLVIVDDIWTTEAWDDIQMCFPFQNNGSRILLTTRNKEVADYASLGTSPYKMRLLTFDECWNLLYQKVFKNEYLTPEFEEIGKDIIKKSQGLPLAIVVMAGVLLKKGKSLDEWKKVVEDLNLAMSMDLDRCCSGVLALSYYHLPHHLRACLLHFAVFRKGSDIQVGRLTRLWAAEGFVKVKRLESFKMVADKYLKDLIDRCLVSVNTWSFFGKIKSCGIHDMIYDFCLQEAQNTSFLNIIKEKDVRNQGSEPVITSYPRRISIQSYTGMNYQLDSGDDTCAKVHSILYCGSIFSTNRLEFSCFKRLRVLDLIPVTLNHKPNSIGGLVWLRYLAFTIGGPSSTPDITNLKNLQTLIIQYAWHSMRINSDILSPPYYDQIWGMSQLRYLKSSQVYLDNPPRKHKSTALLYLDTLSGLNPACCSISVLKGISTVKRLKICGTRNEYRENWLRRFHYCDLSHLHQLVSLSIVVEETKFEGPSEPMTKLQATLLPQASAFPQTLKKLTLQATYLPWKEMMRTVSKLPKLEALKLERFACQGRKWETIGDGFPQLKLLLLDCTSLVLWKTSSDHFPRLERLVLIDCYSLVSIPQEFADITTLQVIELDMCKRSVVDSAIQIQQEVGDILSVLVKNPIFQEKDEEEVSWNNDVDGDVMVEEEEWMEKRGTIIITIISKIYSIAIDLRIDLLCIIAVLFFMFFMVGSILATRLAVRYFLKTVLDDRATLDQGWSQVGPNILVMICLFLLFCFGHRNNSIR